MVELTQKSCFFLVVILFLLMREMSKLTDDLRLTLLCKFQYNWIVNINKTCEDSHAVNVSLTLIPQQVPVTLFFSASSLPCQLF